MANLKEKIDAMKEDAYMKMKATSDDNKGSFHCGEVKAFDKVLAVLNKTDKGVFVTNEENK